MKLREGVRLAETDYGAALLDERSGEYFNLNPTGALVLAKLLEGGSPGEAAEELTSHYDVRIDEASRDVDELVAELESANLLERP